VNSSPKRAIVSPGRRHALACERSQLAVDLNHMTEAVVDNFDSQDPGIAAKNNHAVGHAEAHALIDP